MKSYFEYGEKETSYLKSRDKRLGEVIDRVGPIYREVDPDLFFPLSIISSDNRFRQKHKLRFGNAGKKDSEK